MPPVPIGTLPGGFLDPGITSPTVETVRICFGDVEVDPLFAGLSGFVGVYQIVVRVPPGLPGGDVLVYVPSDRTVFTGDILFIEGHPIIWAGPTQNWINACQLIIDLDVETVVPGHGPITDKHGAEAVMTYLEYISQQARERFDAGMDAFEAAQDISLSDYSSWGDAERIAVNVATLYREFSGADESPNIGELFGQMATLAKARR